MNRTTLRALDSFGGIQQLREPNFTQFWPPTSFEQIKEDILHTTHSSFNTVFWDTRNRVEEKLRYRRSILVLKQENGTVYYKESDECIKSDFKSK